MTPRDHCVIPSYKIFLHSFLLLLLLTYSVPATQPPDLAMTVLHPSPPPLPHPRLLRHNPGRPTSTCLTSCSWPVTHTHNKHCPRVLLPGWDLHLAGLAFPGAILPTGTGRSFTQYATRMLHRALSLSHSLTRSLATLYYVFE